MPRHAPSLVALLGAATISSGYYAPTYVNLAQTSTLASSIAQADLQRRAFAKRYLDCAYASSLTRLKHSDTAVFWREARRSKFDSSELAPYLARIDSVNSFDRKLSEDNVESPSTCEALLKEQETKEANGNAIVWGVLLGSFALTLLVLLSVHK